MAENKAPQELFDDIYLGESYLVGLFWSNPEIYLNYSEDKISHKTFGNKIWSFYFYIGRELATLGKRIFDDITVEEYISKTKKIKNNYADFGEYQTVKEIMEEVKEKDKNFDGYYDEVKKYNLLRSLHDLLGDRVITTVGKYDYKKLNSEQIGKYWQDALNSKLLLSDSKIEEYNLLEGLSEFIEEIDIKPDIGLPFDNSKDLTNICNGWDFGHIYIFSSFSGKGKSSFTMAKLIISCVKNNEKLLIIANEMGIKEYQKLLLITIMGNEMYEWIQSKGYKGFHRQNIDKGGFSPEDRDKLNEAVNIIKKVTNNKHDFVKFVPLDIYTINNVEKTIRYYANRGFRRLIIDTAKPTEGSHNERWVQFTEDFEKLYKLARPNGGGLNLALFTTVQLADERVKQRFLDETCLGDAKKVKNVASVVWHSRSVWDDEFKGGKKELTVYQYKKSKSEKGYDTTEIKLEKSNDYTYMLVFTSKNRRGMSNDTGLDILVYKVSFNRNSWQEVGWTKIFKEY